MANSETILADIRSYIRTMSAAAARTVAPQVFDIYEKAMVYEKLDGNTTQTSLEQATKISQATLSGWLGRFTEAGLASPPDDTHKGHKALFTLPELGVDIPKLKKKAVKGQTQPRAPTVGGVA